MITEARMIDNFGKELTEEVKQKTTTALMYRFSHHGKAYSAGFNGKTFYSANYLPDESMQPTLIEIDQAYTEALQCDGDIDNSAATKQRLAELRDRKTTWVGKDENLLRLKIDEFIGGSNTLNKAEGGA